MDLQNNDVVISVVIPAYNRANIIKECLDSVVAQTYKNIEVIVVDDCSKDNTADIVDAYDDDRVRKCIRLDKNSGACKARNVGADAAIGKYIAFQDSDDIWFPEKLEKQLIYLEGGNFDFVFCGMKRIGQNTESYYPYLGFDENADAQTQILMENRCSTQCMLMTKELFEKVRFDESFRRYQDWDFSIRASAIGKMGYLSEPLLSSEVQSNSISSNVSRFDSLKVIYNKYENIISQNDMLKANFYRKLGGELWKVGDREGARHYYLKSLKWELHFKSLAKCMISFVIPGKKINVQKNSSRIKVGILTYHRAKNYGAFLQSYGLCKRLNLEWDIDAEIIDFCMNKETVHYRTTRNPARLIKHFKSYNFKRKMNNEFKKVYDIAPFSKETCESDSIEEFNKFVEGKYDVIIVGSDEVWKVNSFRGFPSPYWLPEKMDCRKLAYATSSRNDISKLSDDTLVQMKDMLSDFDYITVRDNKTYDLVDNILDKEKKIDIMPDPSFIYNYPVSKERGRNVLRKKAGINKEDKVVVVMTENNELQNAISKELGNEYRLVSVFEYSKSIKNLSNISPFEWIDVLACADIVLASYFHAVCFSIILGKKFLAFGTEIKKDKLIGVLSQMKLEDRYVNINTELYKNGEIKRLVNEVCLSDYDRTEEIDKVRESFNGFLEKIRKKDER